MSKNAIAIDSGIQIPIELPIEVDTKPIETDTRIESEAGKPIKAVLTLGEDAEAYRTKQRNRAQPSMLAAFESMQQIESALGIPIHVQRRAKANGCIAFRANRVHAKELLTWIFANVNEFQASKAKDRIQEADAQIAELKIKRETGQIVDEARQLAKQIITETIAPIRAKLIACAPGLAVRCNPTDPDLAMREIESMIDELLKGTQ